MKNKMPKHFSNNFELRLDKIPTRKSDRMSPFILYIGSLLGLALIALGCYELFGMEHISSEELVKIKYEPMINAVFFDIILIIIGFGIIASLIINYVQFKKIYYDGKSFKIIHRMLGGKRITCSEKLDKYIGVRMRIEFSQLGFLNHNKYIIELLHKKTQKIVPLYVSYREKNIRRIWEYYARTLGLPAVIMTDEGLVTRKVENLDKSIKELAEIGELVSKFDINKPIPKNVDLVFKADKIVLKIRKALWDAYNILTIGVIIIATGLIKLGERALPIFDQTEVLLFNGVMALIIVLAIIILFRKDKIVIKKYKIVNVHKFFGFSKKNDEMDKDDIETIVVNQNPATGRCFVAITSDEKTIIFGKKMPIKDLHWIKDFLIYEIIK